MCVHSNYGRLVSKLSKKKKKRNLFLLEKLTLYMHYVFQFEQDYLQQQYISDIKTANSQMRPANPQSRVTHVQSQLFYLFFVAMR